jgi:hypothetical protein
MLDTSGNNPARQFLFGLINRFMERKRIMDVVINKRKIRDTVRQIVAGGNRTLKQEIRSRFIAGMATGNWRFRFSIRNRGRECLVTARA